MDIPLLTFCQKRLEVLHGAVAGVDGIVVRYIIFMVRGTGMNGHQPDAVDAQRLQIVQFGGDSVEVADAVAVGITEGVDENFIPGPVIVIGRRSQFPDPGQSRFGPLRCLASCNRPRRIGDGGGNSRIARPGASSQKQDRQQQAHKTSRCFHGISPSQRRP